MKQIKIRILSKTPHRTPAARAVGWSAVEWVNLAARRYSLSGKSTSQTQRNLKCTPKRTRRRKKIITRIGVTERRENKGRFTLTHTHGMQEEACAYYRPTREREMKRKRTELRTWAQFKSTYKPKNIFAYLKQIHEKFCRIHLRKCRSWTQRET